MLVLFGLLRRERRRIHKDGSDVGDGFQGIVQVEDSLIMCSGSSTSSNRQGRVAEQGLGVGRCFFIADIS
jgi:hypothetical protein